MVTATTKFSYQRDTAGAKAAGELKKLAEQLAAEANKGSDDTKKKALEAAKQTLTKRAEEATKAAAAKETALVVPSNIVPLTVKAAPVEIELPTPELSVKRGAQVESPIAMSRLYNYAEQVDLEVIVPGGLADLKASAPAIAKGKTDGKLTVIAGQNASLGTHTFTLRAKPKYNNQTLQTDRTFRVKVE
jgi:hypothetical protein